ncbi:hypothetical protein GR204_34400 [Rhizobium leguminosarum]|uniref:Uncharacterized protein n=1 Tax=Rhizobium leguminosarum TaxID=384 RepID=A0A6P0BGQ3_RHILE|nr:hypothetical protein [Rhizobium leguminosarum]NEI38965.1 hypothetical protein [Rhizobium leguminosarum]NEI45695.1 hypothetical protein [Rhizobium leguminosarum]
MTMYSQQNLTSKMSPQGFDIAELIKQIVPIVMNTLSSNPQAGGQAFQPQFSVGGGFTINPFSSGPGNLAPQGFDFGGLIRAIVPIVLSTLSSNPQAGAQGNQPHYNIGGGASINPMSSAPGAFAPQGFDFGGLIKAIVPIVMSVLSANPQAGGPGMQPQFNMGGGAAVNPMSSGPGSLAPQGFDFGGLVKAIVPIVVSLLSANPQMGAQGVQPQFSIGGGFTVNPFSSGPGALAPQGFDFGGLIRTIVPIVLSVLSAMPSSGGIQPQSSGPVAPQGFDFGSLIEAVVPIVLSVLSSQPQNGGAPSYH